MKHVYYVVALVIRRTESEQQLLMARRAEGSYMGGTWQLITGGLHADEIAWQGVLREILEETGLKPVELYRLSTLTSFYRPDSDSLNAAPMFCAVVDEASPVIINAEHTEYVWINVTEASQRLMWPSDRQALDEVRAVILNDGMGKEYLRIPQFQ